MLVFLRKSEVAEEAGGQQRAQPDLQRDERQQVVQQGVQPGKQHVAHRQSPREDFVDFQRVVEPGVELGVQLAEVKLAEVEVADQH